MVKGRAARMVKVEQVAMAVVDLERRQQVESRWKGSIERLRLCRSTVR
jgi:hypothetical protein